MHKKKIIYYVNWAADSGLVDGSVRPCLDLLCRVIDRENILLVTTESSAADLKAMQPFCVDHKSVHVQPRKSVIGRFYSALMLCIRLIQIQKETSAECFIARGAPAGIYTFLASRITQSRFYIESCEPHGEYMVDAQVWPRKSAIYTLFTLFYSSMVGGANLVSTVSTSYAAHLKRTIKRPHKVFASPCFANKQLFAYSESNRIDIRHRLHLGNRLVGIYAGKFGGLYEDFRALRFMKGLIDCHSSLFFIILTSLPTEEVKKLMIDFGISSDSFWIGHVSHQSVASYCSAADFGLGFHKEGPFSFAYSPIKYAEYWSCGLPVIVPRGVGDESSQIQSLGLGTSVCFDDPNADAKAIKTILRILSTHDHRSRISSCGRILRDPGFAVSFYESMVLDLQRATTWLHD